MSKRRASDPPADVPALTARLRRQERTIEHLETIIAALRQARAPWLTPGSQSTLGRLLDVWSDLDLASSPITVRNYDTNIQRTPNPPTPGAATATYRKIKSRLNRRINQAIDDALDQLAGEWVPPPRCSSCNRSGRYSARLCDRCGGPLGTPTTNQSEAQSEKGGSKKPSTVTPPGAKVTYSKVPGSVS